MNLLFLLSLVPALGLAAQDGDADRRQLMERMMEARFHLNGVFDKDMGARVPVAELGLPAEAVGRFDGNGDGVVTYAEFEEMERRGASGPAAPRDRSEFTHLREGGFPLNVDPEIVPADAVDIGDNDMVLGVVINGEPRAYPVNYMNGPYNEVVNDELGGQAIAPSW